jgi:2-dehydropantoate 2-reductase
MKHAVLGPGGVGGLVGGRLALAGHDVIFVVRPLTIRSYPPSIHVDSTVYGSFDAPMRLTESLSEPVDALWVTCKATSLDAALSSVAPNSVGNPLVVPLLNGLDHIERLRQRFGAGNVVPGAIRTESTRIAPGHIIHNGWHVLPADAESRDAMVPSEPMQLASDGPRADEVGRLADEVRSAGIGCQLWPDEGQVVWQKLAILASYALATTAVGGSIGRVRANETVLFHLRRATDETVRVANALGVRLELSTVMETLERYPDAMRVSMERDLTSGADLEIANIADPIIREGRSHNVSVESMEWLREQALSRLAARA